MPGGRPTTDPKQTLVAVRLADRQLRALSDRSRREGVSVSEALRRCLDEWAAAQPPTPPRARPPTTEERASFDAASPRSASGLLHGDVELGHDDFDSRSRRD